VAVTVLVRSLITFKLFYLKIHGISFLSRATLERDERMKSGGQIRRREKIE
jgi:hypothetical protein